MKLHDQHRAIFPNPRCVDCGAPVVLGECSAAAKQRQPSFVPLRPTKAYFEIMYAERHRQLNEEREKNAKLEETIAGLRLKLRMARNVEQIIEMLRSLQFASNGYCPICRGWNNGRGAHGETTHHHRYDCSLKKLLEGKQ